MGDGVLVSSKPWKLEEEDGRMGKKGFSPKVNRCWRRPFASTTTGKKDVKRGKQGNKTVNLFFPIHPSKLLIELWQEKFVQNLMHKVQKILIYLSSISWWIWVCVVIIAILVSVYYEQICYCAAWFSGLAHSLIPLVNWH